MQVLDHGYLKLAEPEDENVWGSDENIIRAARMSTDGAFRGWGTACACTVTPYDSRKHNPESNREKEPDLDCHFCKGSGYTTGDEKLLRYLWENKHLTPFEMAGCAVEIQAPIFVVREWHRHRTQSYNELSGRYTELPDLYYIPSVERLVRGKQAIKNKQSSEGGFTGMQAEYFQQVIREATYVARSRYESLLEAGVSRELARLVIPVNQYTRFRASANLRNWLGFLTLRLDAGAQWEIRQYAEAMAKIIEQHFPRTWSLFNER